MQKEFEKNKICGEAFSIIRKKESYLGEENVKEILHDVLNGLYSMSKEKHGYHKHQL
jgi:hypothetical protein